MSRSLQKHLVMSAGSNGFKVMALVILITLLWNKAYVVGMKGLRNPVNSIVK